MVYLRGEPLFRARIFRWGKGAADIARDDLRFRPQFRQRPRNVLHREAAALPIRHCVFRPQAIEVDRDINVGAGESLGELCKPCAPVRGDDCALSILFRSRPPVGPRKTFQSPASSRPPISEELSRPPALEISTAPNADFLKSRKLERTID